MSEKMDRDVFSLVAHCVCACVCVCVCVSVEAIKEMWWYGWRLTGT